MSKAVASLAKEARRALDSSDPDAALKHCRAALKLPEGAGNVKILLLTAQACQDLDPPRLEDAYRALNKALQVEPDSLKALGMMRNILRRLPSDMQRSISLKQVYERLIALCANDSESQSRLMRELIEVLESGQEESSKLEALEIRMQMLPLTDQDLVDILRRQLDLKIDCSESLHQLIDRHALPDFIVDDVLSDIFAKTVASNSEDVWSRTLSLLVKLSESCHSKAVLQHLVSLSLIYRRIFTLDKPFFKRACCALLRLIPNDCFAWAALGCISVRPLHDAPENLEHVRAAIRIGELATAKVPFPKNEPLPLAIVIAESFDITISLQLELRPLDLVSMKVRLRSALDLIEGIFQRCPQLSTWKDSMKTSLRINACLFQSVPESASYLESRHNLHPRARRALISRLIECSRFSAAVKFIEQFWPEDPPTWALSALSWCRFKIAGCQQTDAFLNIAVSVINRSPRCALYHTRVGLMYFAIEDNVDINKRLALDCFMTSARIDPLSSHPWTCLGRYYLEYKKDANRALKCFRKAVSLDPTDSEAAMALCELVLPASDEIVSVCKAAIDTNSFFCEWPWRYLLEARLQREEWLDCVGAIQNLLKATPNDVRLWTQLGFVYLRMGKFQSSARAYSQAVKVDHSNIRAHYSLADVYLRMYQPADAITELEHTLSLEVGGLRPAIVELLRQTYYENGKQLAQSGEFDNSKQQFDRAIDLPISESAFLETWKLIGDIQLARSDPLLAGKAYARAVFRYPSLPDSWYDLGIALYKAGFISAAAHSLRSAIVLRPEYSDAWIALAFTIPLTKSKLRSYCLSRAVKSSGHRSAPAWTAFALLALQYGDINAAQKAVVEAQRNDPVFDHLPTAQGLVFRASVALTNGS